jgi:GntR family transcriptional regulator
MDAAPLYRGLRATLMAEISGGKFPVGSGFPTDYELCARFRVSRHTVREALRSLQDQGMLVRQPGSGTTVTALPGAPHYVHTIESLEQLYSNARTARLAIVTSAGRGLASVSPPNWSGPRENAGCR